MAKVRNTTGADLALDGVVIPAGRVADVPATALADATALINAGKLIVQHTRNVDPADLEALRALAHGDGRTTEVRKAREKLEGIGETW